jgi:AcrR family transcriptional regulator
MAELPGSPHRRATPVQARSAITLDLILAAAAGLLVDQGLPGFNTNAVAKAAGVNVATLYHYFPNKTAVLREMFDRYQADPMNDLLSRLDDLATTEDLAGWIHNLADTLFRFRMARPADVALRRACRAVPEMARAEEAVHHAAAQELAGALRRRFVRLSEARAATAARVVVEVTVALLDFAADRPDSAPVMTLELERLLVGYFSDLAEG